MKNTTICKVRIISIENNLIHSIIEEVNTYNSDKEVGKELYFYPSNYMELKKYKKNNEIKVGVKLEVVINDVMNKVKIEKFI
jgi:hypothetical protein